MNNTVYVITVFLLAIVTALIMLIVSKLDVNRDIMVSISVFIGIVFTIVSQRLISKKHPS